MAKVSKDQIIQDMIDNDIWDFEWENVDQDYWLDYWNDVAAGSLSWQWYMNISLVRDKGWKYIIVSEDHKNVTVINWLKENYPSCNFKNENNHFLIEQEEVATIMALKWI